MRCRLEEAEEFISKGFCLSFSKRPLHRLYCPNQGCFTYFIHSQFYRVPVETHLVFSLFPPALNCHTVDNVSHQKSIQKRQKKV